MLRLAARTRGAFDEGVDAVVVTHGTDTIEESAFLLELLHDRQHPVVVTGAQRAFDSPAPDGPENLLAAVRVATSEHSRGLGVLVVFDGFAWPARGVRKTETLASAAFSAPGRGPCLRLSPDRVLPLSTPWRPHAFPWEPLAPGASGPRLPRVDVVAAYAGSDAALLDAAVAAGARGIVVQALGAGNLPPAMTERVRDLVREGIPVLVSSRVPSGPVSPLYTGGGGADLLRDGAVFAADLSPWQARLLLCVALASRPDEPTRAVRDWLG
jgi:L-asparaginase